MLFTDGSKTGIKESVQYTMKTKQYDQNFHTYVQFVQGSSHNMSYPFK